MFQGTYKPVFTPPGGETVNTKVFRGGILSISVMHGASYTQDSPFIFGKGPQFSGSVLIQNSRGKTLGKTVVERGRLEAWGNEYHWAGYDSDLSEMRLYASHPSEIQIIVFEMNRNETHEVFGRATFDCQFFPDNKIYQCHLPIESIPNGAEEKHIVGALCVNIQYCGASPPAKLQNGDEKSISCQDMKSLSFQVSFDEVNGHMEGQHYTLAVMMHGKVGEFISALTFNTNIKEGDNEMFSKKGKASITLVSSTSISDNESSAASCGASALTRKVVLEVKVELASLDEEVSSFFLLMSASRPNSSLNNLKNIHSTAIDTESGNAIAQYDVEAGESSTSLLFMRCVRENHGRSPMDWRLKAILESDSSGRNYGHMIPVCMNSLCDGCLENATKGTNEHRMINLDIGEVFAIEDCFSSESKMTEHFSLGLQWDMFEGQTLDLDLGCLCLDEDLQLVDMCHFQQIESKDQAIVHGGDIVDDAQDKEDDEEIHIDLGKLNASITYIAFYVTSYEGKELNEVERCFAHFYVTESKRDIFTFVVDDGSDNSVFGSNCAVLATIIFKCSDNKWYFKNAASGNDANMIEDSLPHLQAYIREHKIKETQEKVVKAATSV